MVTTVIETDEIEQIIVRIMGQPYISKEDLNHFGGKC